MPSSSRSPPARRCCRRCSSASRRRCATRGRTRSRALRHGGRSATDGPARHRGRHLLVVAQTAAALVLLVGAGLLARSFSRLMGAELGFEPARRADVPRRAAADDLSEVRRTSRASASSSSIGWRRSRRRGGGRRDRAADCGSPVGHRVRVHRPADRARPSAADHLVSDGHARLLPDDGDRAPAGPRLRHDRAARRRAIGHRQPGAGEQYWPDAGPHRQAAAPGGQDRATGRGSRSSASSRRCARASCASAAARRSISARRRRRTRRRAALTYVIRGPNVGAAGRRGAPRRVGDRSRPAGGGDADDGRDGRASRWCSSRSRCSRWGSRRWSRWCSARSVSTACSRTRSACGRARSACGSRSARRPRG